MFKRNRKTFVNFLISNIDIYIYVWRNTFALEFILYSVPKFLSVQRFLL